MSIKIMSLIWEIDIRPSLKLVAVALADWASDKGDNIYPSIPTLARKSGMSVRTVQRCLLQLIRIGMIQVDYKASIYGTNLYKINLNWVMDHQPDRDDEPVESDAGVVTDCHQGGVKLSPGWCQNATRVVSNCHQGGVILSPKPLVKPSDNPSEESLEQLLLQQPPTHEIEMAEFGCGSGGGEDPVEIGTDYPEDSSEYTWDLESIARSEAIPLSEEIRKNNVSFISYWLYALSQDTIKAPGRFAVSRMKLQPPEDWAELANDPEILARYNGWVYSDDRMKLLENRGVLDRVKKHINCFQEAYEKSI